MLWLYSIPLPLLDYRLIAINALIYDLIASEIVNVNAHIVIAATDMTEFDKSATMRTTCTTTNILRLAHERQREPLKSPTTRRSTTMSNDDKAELAFLVQKSRHASDHVVMGENNNLSGRNIGFALLANGKGISLPITAQTAATQTSDDVVVSIIAARPFDMMTDDSSRFANSFNVMPTINERVDNFRNDKKQIASTAMTGVATAARTAAAVTAKAEVRVDSKQPAIKVRVITAIKLAATQFTTSASKPPVLISASIIPTRTRRVSIHAAQAVTSATPAQTTKATTTSKATITMSKLLTTTTTAAASTTRTATMETRAMPWWPTLHGHDLLSSTNGMPNCRVTPESACVEQCNATTNSNTRTTTTTTLAFVESSRAIKSAAAAAAAPAALSPSSPSSSIPATPVLTAKVEATTATVTVAGAAEAKTSQQTWSTTHVTKSGSTKLSPSNNNSAAFNANSNKKKFATATPTTKAAQTLSERNAARPTRPAMSPSSSRATNLTATETTIATIATTTAKSKTSKSTGALQLHWQRILSRQKRYLAFPEGSSFSVSICITVGIIGNPSYNYMSFGLNWGVSYDLPNATWVLNQIHGLSRRPMPEAVLHRRSKRALYERIGEAVDNMGYNGRECVLRALCESRQYFARKKMGMIGEMLRVVFSLPKQRLFTRELRESSEILAYDHAYRKARTVDCATHYDCSFSLLELAFGKYAKPPTDYYSKFGM